MEGKTIGQLPSVTSHTASMSSSSSSSSSSSDFKNDDVLSSLMAYMPLKTLLKFSMTARHHAVIMEKQLNQIRVLDLSEFVFDNSHVLECLKDFIVNKPFRNLCKIVPASMCCKLLKEDKRFAAKLFSKHRRFTIPVPEEFNDNDNGDWNWLKSSLFRDYPDLTVTSAEFNQHYLPVLGNPRNSTIRHLKVKSMLDAAMFMVYNNLPAVRVLSIETWWFCCCDLRWQTFLQLLAKCTGLEELVVGSSTQAQLHSQYGKFDAFCQKNKSHNFKISLRWVYTDANHSILQDQMPNAVKYVKRFRCTTTNNNVIPFLSEMTQLEHFSSVQGIPLNWNHIHFPNLREIHTLLDQNILLLIASAGQSHSRLEKLELSCREYETPMMGKLLIALDSFKRKLPLKHLALFTFSNVGPEMRNQITTILFNHCPLLQSFHVDVSLTPVEICRVLESAPHLKTLSVYLNEQDMDHVMLRTTLKQKIRRHPCLLHVQLMSENLDRTIEGCHL